MTAERKASDSGKLESSGRANAGIDQAAEIEGAICQDTGMPTFEVKAPVSVNQIWMKARIKEAIVEATKRGKLRPNSVDSLTGENSGNNLGPGTPVLHFEQWARDDIEVKLLLKGGGCENMNAQYSLPSELAHLGWADRTIEGVRKSILHAVWTAQGKGCAPGAQHGAVYLNAIGGAPGQARCLGCVPCLRVPEGRKFVEPEKPDKIGLNHADRNPHPHPHPHP